MSLLVLLVLDASWPSFHKEFSDGQGLNSETWEWLWHIYPSCNVPKHRLLLFFSHFQFPKCGDEIFCFQFGNKLPFKCPVSTQGGHWHFGTCPMEACSAQSCAVAGGCSGECSVVVKQEASQGVARRNFQPGCQTILFWASQHLYLMVSLKQIFSLRPKSASFKVQCTNVIICSRCSIYVDSTDTEKLSVAKTVDQLLKWCLKMKTCKTGATAAWEI